MKNDHELPGVIHIHAQYQWHEEAYIVADRKALEVLKHLIDSALKNGSSAGEFMPQDGECFDLHVVMDDSDWQSDSWKRRALGYIDEIARATQRGLWPWEEFEQLLAQGTR